MDMQFFLENTMYGLENIDGLCFLIHPWFHPISTELPFVLDISHFEKKWIFKNLNEIQCHISNNKSNQDV